MANHSTIFSMRPPEPEPRSDVERLAIKAGELFMDAQSPMIAGEERTILLEQSAACIEEAAAILYPKES